MTAGRVLVTRPEPGCSRTADRVAALGLEPVKLPVTEAEFDQIAIRRALSGQWGALAVTSANAVLALQQVPEAVAAWRNLPVFAVGARTAGLASRAGFACAEAGGAAGEALAGKIIDAASRGRVGVSTDAPLLYCAGKARSDDFERALRLASVPFSVAECYAMRRLSYPAEVLAELVSGPFEAALFFSRETAVSFFRLMAGAGLMDHFRVRCIVCLSEKVTTGLPVRLQCDAVTPHRPSEEAVLAILAAMRE